MVAGLSPSVLVTEMDAVPVPGFEESEAV